MTLARFTIDATPGGVSLAVDGRPIPAGRVVLDAQAGQIPVLTVWPTGPVRLEGDGIVQVATDPSPADVDAAAVEAINRIPLDEFTAACQARLRAGARDPFEVALTVIKEMADG